MKANRREEAKAFLVSWLKQRKDVSWTTQVIRYLNGELAEDKLLSLANDSGTRTEAYTYLGEISLFHDDAVTARRHFEWVSKNGSKDYMEYNLAAAELKRINLK